MLQMSEDEFNNLISQFVISNLPVASVRRGGPGPEEEVRHN